VVNILMAFHGLLFGIAFCYALFYLIAARISKRRRTDNYTRLAIYSATGFVMCIALLLALYPFGLFPFPVPYVITWLIGYVIGFGGILIMIIKAFAAVQVQ
jgi:amino acid transporter